jgi:hypothetical protein
VVPLRGRSSGLLSEADDIGERVTKGRDLSEVAANVAGMVMGALDTGVLNMEALDMGALDVAPGDATAPQGTGPKVIAHVCDDMGGWGKGFVVALSKRWPEPEAAYQRWHR